MLGGPGLCLRSRPGPARPGPPAPPDPARGPPAGPASRSGTHGSGTAPAPRPGPAQPGAVPSPAPHTGLGSALLWGPPARPPRPAAPLFRCPPLRPLAAMPRGSAPGGDGDLAAGTGPAVSPQPGPSAAPRARSGVAAPCPFPCSGWAGPGQGARGDKDRPQHPGLAGSSSDGASSDRGPAGLPVLAGAVARWHRISSWPGAGGGTPAAGPRHRPGHALTEPGQGWGAVVGDPPRRAISRRRAMPTQPPPLARDEQWSRVGATGVTVTEPSLTKGSTRRRGGGGHGGCRGLAGADKSGGR